MKYLYIKFLLLSFAIHSQTIEFGNETFVTFDLKFSSDTTTVDGISWDKENLVSRFDLKGKTKLRYSIKIVNDTVAELYQYKNEKWQFQESIPISGWVLRKIVDGTIISEFKITDFDEDGNQDLVCWAHSNVNGNLWTYIYLNKTNDKKIVKLQNFAEQSDIWDAPEYDKKNKVINCELFSSAYGFSYTSKYSLVNHQAIPLEKTFIDSSNPEFIIEQYYIGNEKEWQLVKSTKTSIKKEN